MYTLFSLCGVGREVVDSRGRNGCRAHCSVHPFRLRESTANTFKPHEKVDTYEN